MTWIQQPHVLPEPEQPGRSRIPSGTVPSQSQGFSSTLRRLQSHCKLAYVIWHRSASSLTTTTSFAGIFLLLRQFSWIGIPYQPTSGMPTVKKLSQRREILKVAIMRSYKPLYTILPDAHLQSDSTIMTALHAQVRTVSSLQRSLPTFLCLCWHAGLSPEWRRGATVGEATSLASIGVLGPTALSLPFCSVTATRR